MRAIGGYLLPVVALTMLSAAEGTAEVPTIAPADVARWQEEGRRLILVDTRPRPLFDAVHARGAIAYPPHGMGEAELPRNAAIVIYDGGPVTRDSAQAAAALLRRGYAEVWVLEGGFEAWEAQRLPVVAQPGLSSVPFIEPLAPEDLLSMLEEGRRPLILDVRTAQEYAQGRIPGARSAPGSEAALRAAAEARPEAPIVLYDGGSGEAADIAELLRRRGYRAVRYLHGGSLLWSEKSYRLEKGAR